MVLKRSSAVFTKDLFLTTPIEESLLETLHLDSFDKDGYELESVLEQSFYQADNRILNTKIQDHISDSSVWFYDDEKSQKGLVLDHSMILTRCSFSGQAREQLIRFSKNRPILNKLLALRPKWGLDFSLDFVEECRCFEVIHIEQDFLNYQDAQEAKYQLENMIESVDWFHGAKMLKRNFSEWSSLNSDDQSDYKARYFGFYRAFDNLKAFNY